MEDEKILEFVAEYRDTFRRINEEYKCTICQKLLCDPVSATCGCNYCKECTENHFIGAISCPGRNRSCRDINLGNGNFIMNHFLRNRIRNVEINCPNYGCTFQSRIEDVINHFAECTKGESNCQFSVIGCRSKVKDESEKEHSNKNIVNHLKYVFQYMNEIKNEIMILKNENCELKQRVTILKDKDIDTKINEFYVEVMQLETRNNELLAEVTDITNQNYNQRINVLHDNMEQLNGKMDRDNRNCNEKVVALQERIEELVKNDFHLKRCIQGQAELDSVARLKLTLNNNPYYIWKVDNMLKKWDMAKKREKISFSSERFYIEQNSYRMRLKIYPNGVFTGEKTHITFNTRFCIGEFNDDLPWPVRNTIQASLINAHTLEECCMDTFDYESELPYRGHAFEKPIEKDNKGFDLFNFVPWEYLLGPDSPMKNDTIIIKIAIRR